VCDVFCVEWCLYCVVLGLSFRECVGRSENCVSQKMTSSVGCQGWSGVEACESVATSEGWDVVESECGHVRVSSACSSVRAGGLEGWRVGVLSFGLLDYWIAESVGVLNIEKFCDYLCL
jgi:hypothetical protein